MHQFCLSFVLNKNNDQNKQSSVPTATAFIFINMNEQSKKKKEVKYRERKILKVIFIHWWIHTKQNYFQRVFI